MEQARHIYPRSKLSSDTRAALRDTKQTNTGFGHSDYGYILRLYLLPHPKGTDPPFPPLSKHQVANAMTQSQSVQISCASATQTMPTRRNPNPKLQNLVPIFCADYGIKNPGSSAQALKSQIAGPNAAVSPAPPSSPLPPQTALVSAASPPRSGCPRSAAPRSEAAGRSVRACSTSCSGRMRWGSRPGSLRPRRWRLEAAGSAVGAVRAAMGRRAGLATAGIAMRRGRGRAAAAVGRTVVQGRCRSGSLRRIGKCQLGRRLGDRFLEGRLRVVRRCWERRCRWLTG